MSSLHGGSADPDHDDLALLRALLDKAALALAVVDAEGRLRLTSQGLRDLVGTPPAGATSNELPGVFHLYDAKGARPLQPEEVPSARARAGETVRDEVISTRRPGAPVRYLRCNAAPLTDDDGRPIGAMSIIDDITTEHVAGSRQETIRRMLVDTVNHELRTPLTAVVANAELLLELGADLPAEIKERLAAIVRCSALLRDTVQHVTDLVDLEAVRHAVRTEQRVSKLVDVVVNRYWYQAEQRAITLTSDCPDHLAWSIDPGLVVKAVSALVHNAITHGPAQSTVRLTARVDHDVLLINVSDQGSGIHHDDQERLTKPFERGLTALDSAHTRGLGLPIAHAVATCHHGALTFARKPHGFSVTIVLP